MNDVLSVSNARSDFESLVRRMGPGYSATINGLSNPIRIARPVGEVGDSASVEVHYRHVIDTHA